MVDDLMPPVGKININKSTLKAGTPLYRIHREKFAGNAFNTTSGGDARFSPIFDQDNKVIATLFPVITGIASVQILRRFAPEAQPDNPAK
ncbi:hypothetical protein [Serratia quinivorans]|uniref:hypothetical protein n=1 Tax=Serratia quinivorans TaxID=137545 RepID=UPI003F9DCC86